MSVTGKGRSDARARVNDFDQELTARLDRLRQDGLWRELRRIDSAQGTRVQIGGRSFLNFSSNDYLGLATHPALREAAIRAIRDFGTGSGASRLICGSLAPHHGLEEALAVFKGTAAALTFSTGYAAAVGTIAALLGPDDIIVVDRLVHACCIDAARLSGAKLRVFGHNDLTDLESILAWAAGKTTPTKRPRVLIVTESVFSMDGDTAPLRALVELKERYGAWLMLDEAHATGMFGDHRRGLAEAEGVTDRVEIQMGTLGKAFGASGGYIAGSRALIDLLINRARSFIFSTAPVPAAAAAARAGVELVQGEEGCLRATQLQNVVRQLRATLGAAPPTGPAAMSAIIPLIIGDEGQAVVHALALREQGVFVPAIRFPTVARGSARLRFTATASHSAADLAELDTALRALPRATSTP